MQNPLDGPRVIISDAITEADTGTTVVAIEIPAGTYIPPYGVSIEVAEDFAGGTPLLDVGDADPDGWIDQTEITATTAGHYAGVAAAFALTGKYYATADSIDVVVSASLTAGTAYVVARLYNFSNRTLAAV